MKFVRILLTTIAASIVAGCSQGIFWAVNAPVSFDNIKITRDVDFSNGLSLDIYSPKSTEKSLTPVLIFFYGGRWTEGSKEQYAFIAEPFIRRGYTVVIPDYRKYPEVKHPSFVEDAASAISWTIDHIARYGGNPEKIYVSGHSSGAHIAALAITNPIYLNIHGKDRSAIKAFAGLAGPYNFIPEEADLKDMFGPPEKYPTMQVSTYIDGNQPPMLLLWGEKDTLVGKFNTDKVKEAAFSRGGCVKTTIYPDIDHVWIIGALSWAGKDKAPILDEMDRFFKNPECA